ncbi:caffeic acid 3-O-methyltransferase-like [Andrographis paniculata]|uniref:caffeic acid 3-O-methyltransferase-like n=1 Tax=Andrographis paniculata TaxID=175694 RepID=UPI0021E9A240|nr:caffeic acid 3-O-methyltransferase-like [Andrographis paniculata]
MEKKVNHTDSSCGFGEDDDAGVEAMAAATSHIFHFVLNAAIELDLFSIIGGAGDGVPISTSDIVSRLPIRGREDEAAAALNSMLRSLASYSLLACSMSEVAPGGAFERRYRLTPSGKFFVRDASGSSLVKYQELGYQYSESLLVCQNLKDAVLGGGVLFERLNGKSFYEHVKCSNTGYAEAFHDAMRAHSVFILGKVLEKYHGFENLDSIVYVAGGDGTALEMIISKYPSIRGINFDLPEVIKTAPLSRGIEHIGGDMFVEVPKAEAILFKVKLDTKPI